jgi:hypothetical protein
MESITPNRLTVAVIAAIILMEYIFIDVIIKFEEIIRFVVI